MFEKILFELAGFIFKYLFLQENESESEQLAIGDRSFIVKRMATIHVKVMVFVRGFNMQVSSDLAIFQVDSCV